MATALAVQLLPVPAMTGTRPAARSTVKRMTSLCSASVMVALSPVVPQATSPAMPDSICQSMRRP